MRNEILEYAKSQELTVKETGGGAYDISFNAKPNFKVTIIVPFFVLEWSISVKTRDDDDELFFDSCEHFGDRDENKLDEEMEEAVINTINALNNADIRITKTSLFQLFKRRFFKRKILEVKTDTDWVNFWELAFRTFE
jgi:hypothetical protein